MPTMRRYRLVLALGAACLAIWAILRAVLWWRFGFDSGVSAWMLPAILAGGAVNDLVVAAYLLALLALYSALPPDRWYESSANRWLLAAGSWLTIAWLSFLAFTEFYFFQEFDARFNLVAFDYLAYPTEVAGDVWAEYPVIRVALESALIASAVLWMIRDCFRRDSTATGPLAIRARPALLHLAVVLLCALFYPTDLLSMSSSRITNELVQNGTSSFFLAARTNEIEYHAYYKSADSC